MTTRIRRTVTAAMLAAMVCVMTMLIQIPTPLKGYIHLGDSIVLLAGWLLPPPYGMLAAGLGAMLADVFAGYIIYAPATFVIKGGMAMTAWFLFDKRNGRFSERVRRLLSAAAAQLVMIAGYLAYESLLYGMPLAAVNIPMNLLQAAVGIVLGSLLMNFFDKSGLWKE